MPRARDIRLPAPYLKKVWLDATKVDQPNAYPFRLPMFSKGFEQVFEAPITIIVGENSSGKSTLLEGVAAVAGFDQAEAETDIARWTIQSRRKSAARIWLKR